MNMCVHMCVFTNVCVCIYMCVCSQMYVHLYVCMKVCVCVCVCAHACVHVHGQVLWRQYRCKFWPTSCDAGEVVVLPILHHQASCPSLVWVVQQHLLLVCNTCTLLSNQTRPQHPTTHTFKHLLIAKHLHNHTLVIKGDHGNTITNIPYLKRRPPPHPNLTPPPPPPQLLYSKCKSMDSKLQHWDTAVFSSNRW